MTRQARDIVVTGRVQGVGYRPFVYVTARQLELTGTVLNGSGKVFIHVEGEEARLDQLERELIDAAPPLARPRLAASAVVEATGATVFEILASEAASESEIHVPPDLFTCDDCLAELTGPGERRQGYAFINCTQCGPRYTIITAMPYDRPNTSMAGFPLCDDCRAEYLSPADRRFHAQPLACPVCGPQLTYDRAVAWRFRAVAWRFRAVAWRFRAVAWRFRAVAWRFRAVARRPCRSGFSRDQPRPVQETALRATTAPTNHCRPRSRPDHRRQRRRWLPPGL